jgi:hypothetical protein
MPSTLGIYINSFNLMGYTIQIIDGAGVTTNLTEAQFKPAAASDAINPGDYTANVNNFTQAPKWQASITVVPGIGGAAIVRFKVDGTALAAAPYSLKADASDRTDSEVFS